MNLMIPPYDRNWCREHPHFLISIDWHAYDPFPPQHGRLKEHNPNVENDVPIHHPITHPHVATLESIITFASYMSRATQTGTTLNKVFDTLRSTNSYIYNPSYPTVMATKAETNTIHIFILDNDNQKIGKSEKIARNHDAKPCYLPSTMSLEPLWFSSILVQILCFQ